MLPNTPLNAQSSRHTMQRDAPSPDPRFTRITELPEDFAVLVELSSREDFHAMQRMHEEWDSGVNRFDAPGEALFEARIGSRLVGICGLNRDPYASSSEVGRVRHLYVDPEHRRRGIGRLLVLKIVECSSASFSRLRLRTMRDDAAQLYEALGFRRVEGEPDVSHELRSVSPTR
jgi:GNAT superfamily N-acetyltransferase